MSLNACTDVEDRLSKDLCRYYMETPHLQGMYMPCQYELILNPEPSHLAKMLEVLSCGCSTKEDWRMFTKNQGALKLLPCLAATPNARIALKSNIAGVYASACANPPLARALWTASSLQKILQSICGDLLSRVERLSALSPEAMTDDKIAMALVTTRSMFDTLSDTLGFEGRLDVWQPYVDLLDLIGKIDIACYARNLYKATNTCRMVRVRHWPRVEELPLVGPEGQERETMQQLLDDGYPLACLAVSAFNLSDGEASRRYVSELVHRRRCWDVVDYANLLPGE